jgi:hypothetical protein
MPTSGGFGSSIRCRFPSILGPRFPLSAGMTGLHVGPAYVAIMQLRIGSMANPFGYPSRPTKKLPNSQRILRLLASDKKGTSGMLRHCLIHPVTLLLSLLAPLFRPFHSPVRGLRSAVTERGNPLTFLVFCSDLARQAGPRKNFALLFGLKQESGAQAVGRGDRDQARPSPQKVRRGQSVVIPAQAPPGRPALRAVPGIAGITKRLGVRTFTW